MSCSSPATEAVAVMESLPGVLHLVALDGSTRAKVAELERGAEGNGAAFGTMGFINEGVWRTLERECCYLLIIDSGELLDGYGSQPLVLYDEAKQIVGEWIPDKVREEYAEREDVAFLSEDFVMYMDVEVVGTPYFVIKDMGFEYLEGVGGVRNITGGSVSGPADQFLRTKFGFEEVDCWTHLVGFDVEDQ